jgi:hypothetical protein
MTPEIKLAFQDEALECYRDDQLSWRTPAAAILLIAEYTTDEGPYVDDYFLQIWSLENNSLLCSKTTFYATGRDATFLALATQLGADLNFGLTGSTEWASRIIWPPDLAGHPYFSSREVTPTNWRAKLSRRFFGATKEYFRTEEVQSFLNKHLVRSQDHGPSESASVLS